MRTRLLDLLSDAYLAFTPGGQNMTSGDAVTVAFQLEVYLQAVLISLERVTIYLNEALQG